MEAHIDNFLNCMRTREKPHLDVETGAQGGGRHQSGGAVLPRRQDDVLGREELEGVDKPVKA